MAAITVAVSDLLNAAGGLVLLAIASRRKERRKRARQPSMPYILNRRSFGGFSFSRPGNGLWWPEAVEEISSNERRNIRRAAPFSGAAHWKAKNNLQRQHTTRRKAGCDSSLSCWRYAFSHFKCNTSSPTSRSILFPYSFCSYTMVFLFVHLYFPFKVTRQFQIFFFTVHFHFDGNVFETGLCKGMHELVLHCYYNI